MESFQESSGLCSSKRFRWLWLKGSRKESIAFLVLPCLSRICCMEAQTTSGYLSTWSRRSSSCHNQTNTRSTLDLPMPEWKGEELWWRPVRSGGHRMHSSKQKLSVRLSPSRSRRTMTWEKTINLVYHIKDATTDDKYLNMCQVFFVHDKIISCFNVVLQ